MLFRSERYGKLCGHQIAPAAALAGLPDLRQRIGGIESIEGETQHRYLALRSDLDRFMRGVPRQDDIVRLVPPLDNLMFNRRRFTELFGFTYKFGDLHNPFV